MTTPNTNFERKIQGALVLSAKTNGRSVTAEINQLVAQALGISTYDEILIDVKDRFNSLVIQNNKPYLELIEWCNSEDGKVFLQSEPFLFKGGTNKDFYIGVNLTDNIATVWFRTSSVDSSIRTILQNTLKNNSNKWIELHTGTKHTAIGLNTRVHNEIDQMSNLKQSLIYNILVDLYNLLQSYI